MSESEFNLDMEELVSAEDFLDYFGISYDPAIVHVNRLHILQRFHDYLDKEPALPEDDAAKRATYTRHLTTAYQNFVNSDALTEKVFKVFRMHESSLVQISLSDFKQQVANSAAEI
ncbi:MAG: nitrogenase-stabilizing/protective protein NifW [Candidatus Sedimenticola endophacoides]